MGKKVLDVATGADARYFEVLWKNTRYEKLLAIGLPQIEAQAVPVGEGRWSEDGGLPYEVAVLSFSGSALKLELA